ncbi:MAG: M28 family peptidase [Bacteroidota bacterium]
MKKILITTIALLSIVACENNTKTTTDNTKIEIKKVNAPIFNADSAFVYIEKQISFGPRIPNSDAHKQCANYLVEKLKEYMPNVQVQEAKLKAYDGTILNSKNIIASYKPETKNRIFISAHWDSRPFADHDPIVANRNKPVLGTNDGASGVAVLIEIARLIKLQNPSIGVDLILFDAEDYGEPQDKQTSSGEDSWALGSQYWAKNPHVKGYYAKYGILLDMVGAKGATFPMEEISMYYASHIVRNVWNKAMELGYSDYFIQKNAGSITDDHYYINKIIGIPTIDIIHLDSETNKFFPQWHTASDDINQMDKNTLKAVGQTLMEVLYSEN